MTLPAFLFGLLVATLMGAVFHLWKGGGLGRIILYIGLAWLGFWGGHYLGGRLGWTFWNIGPLNFGMAILVGIVTIFVGYWLSLVSQESTH